MAGPPVRPQTRLVPWSSALAAPARKGKRGIAGVASSQVGGPIFWVGMAHQYASMINIEAFPVGLTSALILNEGSTYRNYLSMRNTNAVAIIYIAFGKDATTQSVYRLDPNVMIAWDAVVPQDDVSVLASLAASTVSLLYSTVDLPPIPVY